MTFQFHCAVAATSLALSFAALGGTAQAQVAPNLPECDGLAGPIRTTTQVMLPLLDTEQEVEVGQSMVSSHYADVHSGPLTLRTPIHFEGRYTFTNFAVNIPAGSYPLSPAGAYVPRDWEYRYGNEARPRTGFSRPDLSLSVDPADPTKLLAILDFGLSEKTFPGIAGDFSSSDCQTTSNRGLRQELLYTGVSQGTISIEYREFSRDMARPAFSQTLRYDLNEGRTIGFRGARFEIMSANNLSVRFKVLRHIEQ